MRSKNFWNDSQPPADAPSATTGQKALSRSSLAAALTFSFSGFILLLEDFDFISADHHMALNRAHSTRFKLLTTTRHIQLEKARKQQPLGNQSAHLSYFLMRATAWGRTSEDWNCWIVPVPPSLLTLKRPSWVRRWYQ